MSARAIWLLPILAVLLYLPYLNAPYFSDDFLFYYNSPPAHLFQYFTGSVAVAHAYRPLEAIYLTIVQRHFGFQTWPIHVAAVSAHMVLCWVTIAAAAFLGFRPAERILAGALVLVTQVAPPAVLGNDTLSQAMSSMLGVLSVYLFATACFESPSQRRPRVLWIRFCFSLLCFFASLFFKETALGFSLLLLALAVAAAGPLRAVRLLLPFGAAGVIYLIARIHAGGQIAAEDTYKISLGLNTIRNLALFAAGAISPVSSVTIAIATQTREMPTLAMAAAATVLVAIVILAGIFLVRRNRIVAWLLGAALAALFPAFLLQHVSELYFYNAVPFVALLFSLALGALWNQGSMARAGAAVCALLLIAGQVAASVQKSSLMYDNGRRAAEVIASLVPRLHSLPPNSRIILVQPPGVRLKYSVYVLEGFDILEFGVGRLGPIYGRPDVLASIAEEAELRDASANSNTVLLTLDGEALRPWQPLGR